MDRSCCRYDDEDGVKLRSACAADSSVLSSEGPSLTNWQVRIGEDDEEKEDSRGGVVRAIRDDKVSPYAFSGLALAEGGRR